MRRTIAIRPLLLLAAVLACSLGVAAETAGALSGAEQAVNTYTTSDQSGGAVAAGGGQFVVVWASDGQDSGSDGIYARRYGAGGAPLSGELHVNTTITSDSAPAVAVAPDGRFAVAWEQFDGDAKIVARLFAADGTPLTGELQVTTPTATGTVDSPVVALDDAANMVVAWHDESTPGEQNILARRYSAAGAALTGNLPIATTPMNEQGPTIAAQPGGSFVAAWQQYHPYPADNDDVLIARFAPDGGLLTAPAPIAADLGKREGNARVATAPDGSVVAAYDGPIWRRFAPDLTPRGPFDFAIDDVPGAEDAIAGLGVAADGSAAIALERRPSGGTGSDIVVRRFDAAGTPTGPSERLSTSDGGYRNNYGTGLALLPDGALGAAWTASGPPDGAGDGDGDGVFARFGAGGGAPAGPPAAPGGGAPPAGSPAVPTPPRAAPPARTPAPTARPRLPSFAALVTLASTRSCVSRRHFVIRLHQPKKGTKIAKATVVLQGRTVATRRGRRITSPIDLRGLPKGRFTVKITIVTTDHHTIKGSRTYRTCSPARAAPKHHKV